jgi:phosphoribosylglycinamide formyltransferase-1
MRLLSPQFVERYPRRILNIHPSLLPKYSGLNTHARALADQEAEHGASVHLVDAGLDSGPLLAQASLNVSPEETEQSLQTRVMSLETELYPTVLNWLAKKRLEVDEAGVFFDGKLLTAPLLVRSV